MIVTMQSFNMNSLKWKNTNMNIHFKDENLFELLKSKSLLRIRFGSNLYGTMDENSDTDYLYIYRTSESEMNSFLNSQHQLQYKEVLNGNSIDHNFVSLHTFIRNLINGDSTVNFEVLFSEDMKNSLYLDFLWEMRYKFINYSIIRSYLGLARRDLKLLSKQRTLKDKNKAALHAYRGFRFAQCLYEHPFGFMNELRSVKEFKKNFSIENSDSGKTLRELTGMISQLREIFNLDWNVKMNKYISEQNSVLLDSYITSLIQSKEWQEKSWNLDMRVFYNSYENWIDYDLN